MKLIVILIIFIVIISLEYFLKCLSFLDIINQFIPAIICTMVFQYLYVTRPNNRHLNNVKTSIIKSYIQMKISIIGILIPNYPCEIKAVANDFIKARALFNMELRDSIANNNSIDYRDIVTVQNAFLEELVIFCHNPIIQSSTKYENFINYLNFFRNLASELQNYPIDKGYENTKLYFLREWFSILTGFDKINGQYELDQFIELVNSI